MPKGQPSGDRIVWDDANEKHLLLCILAEANPAKLDWTRIASNFGKNLSSSAASQKYAKIKTRDRQLFEGGGATGATSSSGKKITATNTKATPTVTNKRSSNGGFKNPAAYSEEADNDKLMRSPSKKFKIKEEVCAETCSVLYDEV
ncbi:uncharacterized protein PV09_00460 [Verruconis gallopava]|uniref:Myb-like domain-containing protein n=1 Tax=Verruconis gallopava TaxID=253628 RepID=A0A0D2BDX7_9PEZI|nr:uncharacterized protein PV09_00460 [Verruconis gallopava]KIW09589.1 hypothetical protein PV09_00460 [Verruconis gallopava]